VRKLKLAIDELKVDSFSVTMWPTPSGTVDARVLDPDYDDIPSPSLEACYPGTGGGGGGVYTVGTCVGPTYCCPVSWKPSCNTCATLCNNTGCDPTCMTCAYGMSCTDQCTNCSL
jgi:hypothetical protein